MTGCSATGCSGERGDAAGAAGGAALTIDKAAFDGHVYLDTAPGVTLMALPAVWLANRVGGAQAWTHSLSISDPAPDRFMRARLRLATASGAAALTELRRCGGS